MAIKLLSGSILDSGIPTSHHKCIIVRWQMDFTVDSHNNNKNININNTGQKRPMELEAKKEDEKNVECLYLLARRVSIVECDFNVIDLMPSKNIIPPRFWSSVPLLNLCIRIATSPIPITKMGHLPDCRRRRCCRRTRPDRGQTKRPPTEPAATE